MKVTKQFKFDSAHFVPNYYGKCERTHGHTYKLHVTVEGEVGENGMTIDFVILKKMVTKKVLDKLDHQLLNDIIPIATAENVAIWIWNQLVDLKTNIKEQLDDPNLVESIKKYYKDHDSSELDTSAFTDHIRLVEVKLWETSNSFVTYNGE